MRPFLPALCIGLAALTATAPAASFCGFYVAGADTKLYNNATNVVLMREGTRTVLSMQNNYQGPPEDFAMVVPVPVVLKKENVKTLPTSIFDHVDHLAAPRLVEYWEQDPCNVVKWRNKQRVIITSNEILIKDSSDAAAAKFGVKIESRFSVGEYDVLILSAKNSLGLDSFLRSEKYRIPAGSEPYLRPYITQGSKFFVAKVDAKKVKFDKGQAMLSPLRFHYDSEAFALPVRLGLINSAGTQDLIVHILARSRYEVANYNNVTIPTNFLVNESVRGSFSTFYASLFDDLVAKNPRAVVTEYAWSPATCDPCPEPPLDIVEMSTLGMDVLPQFERTQKVLPQMVNDYTLTRLHVRYDAKALGEDLVFRAATPILGGNGVPGTNGEMTQGSSPSSSNTFQGRYVMLHPWTGPIACEKPQRGFWGGPDQANAGASMIATNTAFAPRGASLGSFLQSPSTLWDPVVPKPEPSATTGGLSDETNPPPRPVQETPLPAPASRGCASCTTAESRGGFGALLGITVAGLAGILRRRIRH